MIDIASRLANVQKRIESAAARIGTNPADITLIAVTKTHPTEVIDTALKLGIKYIAENKMQDAMRKLPFIREAYDGFHFIGHIQSNKINQVISLNPILIHSIDSLYLAEKLDSTLKRINREMDILIQVNTSGEESKSGIDPVETIDLVEAISTMKAVHIKGLMTIGKYSILPEASRPYFKKLKELFEEIKNRDIPAVEMKYLSMGMSDDFEIAIEEGSNMLRLGSAIFGQRDYGDHK